MEANELVESFTGLKIPKTHATVGLSNLIASHKDYRTLFVNRRLPDQGWSDIEIQHLLFTLATLDTNNKNTVSSYSNGGDSSSSSPRWCGVGEREGRVYSSLVANRHYGLSHGMGRSGDITEPQPKAVGSSVMAKLTLLLALDAIRRGSGLDTRTAAAQGVLLPLCTGMSMSLVLSSLRDRAAGAQQQPGAKVKSIVLWSRIDQKSCFKAIQSAGLTCVVIPTRIEGDEVVTDLEALKEALQTYSGQVLAVITTTSCFAPRVPDHVDHVAKLCAAESSSEDNDTDVGVAHVINHAYGLQCAKTCILINRACTVGRVDAIVCSTDKNFLVPVGGALVLSRHAWLTEGVGKVYAGRASSSPIVDLFITLLSMGMNGYKRVLKDRTALLPSFSDKLKQVAEKHGERLLLCPSNTISFGITLDSLARPRRTSGGGGGGEVGDGEQQEEEDESSYFQSIERDVSAFGAMLFSRCVSGTRVVPRGVTKSMGGKEFQGFGSSTANYPHAYMTAACAVGLGAGELEEFVRRLDKTLADFKKKQHKTKTKQT